MNQENINRQVAEEIASLKARFDHHEEILAELKEGAKDMVKAINQVKYVLIVLSIGVLLNAGPLQSIFAKLLFPH